MSDELGKQHIGAIRRTQFGNPGFFLIVFLLGVLFVWIYPAGPWRWGPLLTCYGAAAVGTAVSVLRWRLLTEGQKSATQTMILFAVIYALFLMMVLG